MTNKQKLKMQRFLIYTFFILLTVLSVAPFWIVLVNSTRSTEQIQQGFSMFPSSSLKANWDFLKGKGFNIFQGYGNSFTIAAGSTILNMYFSSLAAYALTVYNFKGKKFVNAVILFLIMMPPQVNIIGFYRFMARLNLLNSYIPLIVPSIASAGTVFFMKQYLETIYHPSYLDSARMDGAGELKIFHYVILPQMKPDIATMSIFSFVGSWNNFLTPLILINDREKYTLPMLIQLLTTDTYRTEYGSLYLGLGLAIIPLILIYLLLSRQIIGGVTAGGIKE